MEPTPRQQLRILIVCPHKLALEGLRLLLARDEDLYIVGLTADVDQALALLLRLQPDVVISSDSTASQDCASGVQRLRAARPDIPVLVVSPDTRPERVQAALAAGAIGYLPLDADPDELVRAVHTVGRGELTLHPAIVPGLVARLAGHATKEPGPSLKDFTAREREVLTYLARGLSDRDIAQALFISVRTVQSHLANIYEKLGIHSRTEAAVIAVREGWLSS